MGSIVQNLPEPAGDISSQQSRNELQQQLTEATSRLGLSERGSEFDGAPELETDIEIARLREMLSSQEQATLRALGASQDAQKRLKDSQIDAAKLQAQLKGALSAVDAARAAMQPDDLVRVQLARAQKDLQRERTGHQADVEQATAKIAKLETALADALKEVAASKSRLSPRWVLIGVGSVTVVALLALAVFYRGGIPTGGSVRSDEPVSERGPASAPEPVQRFGKTPAANPAGATQIPFARSLDRLTHALSAFPGQDPEAVLLAVSLKQSTAQNKVCAFAWNDGQPALQLAGSAGSMATALSQCADAVERYR